MLGNYLTTALRLLWRERGYAAINVFGLAVGFALCLLVIQFAAYQLSGWRFPREKGPDLPRTRERRADRSPASQLGMVRVLGKDADRAGADPQGAIARSRGSGPLQTGERAEVVSGRGQGRSI